jgi:hypothetical protein
MDNPCRMASVLESVSFAHRRSGSSCIRHLPVRGCWRLARLSVSRSHLAYIWCMGAILRIGPHSTALYVANNSCLPSCRRVQRVPCRDDGLGPQAGREVGWESYLFTPRPSKVCSKSWRRDNILSKRCDRRRASGDHAFKFIAWFDACQGIDRSMTMRPNFLDV